MKKLAKLFITILMLIFCGATLAQDVPNIEKGDNIGYLLKDISTGGKVREKYRETVKDGNITILLEKRPPEIKLLGYSAIFVSVFLGLITIFIIICMWKIFKKAGIKGWKSLIPIRNVFILFKISGRKKLFRRTVIPYIILICSKIFLLKYFINEYIMYGFCCGIVNGFETVIITLLPIALILSFIFKGIMSFSLAKRFGKSKKFGLGLLLLSPIYYGILAFDKNSKYEY